MMLFGEENPVTLKPAARALSGQFAPLPHPVGHGLPVYCEPHHEHPLVHSLAGYVGVYWQ